MHIHVGLFCHIGCHLGKKVSILPTLRGPYCVMTEGSVTTLHDMTARHYHDVAINNPGSTVSGTPGSWTPWAEETGDSEDEIAPSPNMRRALTRGQAKASPGYSSLVGGLDQDWKEWATSKKPRPS
jgi:hypothetical protein